MVGERKFHYRPNKPLARRDRRRKASSHKAASGPQVTEPARRELDAVDRRRPFQDGHRVLVAGREGNRRPAGAQVEIDAPGWAITFGVPGDGIDSLDSELTQPPRSG